MQRRQLLKLGLIGSVAVTGLGIGAQWLNHTAPLVDGQLQEPGRQLMAAVAGAVLEGSLSDDPALKASQIQAHLDRVTSTIRGFPPHAQSELAQLLLLLDSSPGRRWFAGLAAPWAEATVPQVAQALEHLRQSRWTVQQQAYHALRDITNAAYYSEPGTWAHLGYPGPIPV